MGQVKRLAMLLEDCVQRQWMTDEEIIQIVECHWPEIDMEENSQWLRNQINNVRKNPDYYNSMME